VEFVGMTLLLWGFTAWRRGQRRRRGPPL